MKGGILTISHATVSYEQLHTVLMTDKNFIFIYISKDLSMPQIYKYRELSLLTRMLFHSEQYLLNFFLRMCLITVEQAAGQTEPTHMPGQAEH